MNEEVRLETVHIHSRADELIACLEGEIAKRDARIVELQQQVIGMRLDVITQVDAHAVTRAELAALKAQDPVARLPACPSRAFAVANLRDLAQSVLQHDPDVGMFRDEDQAFLINELADLAESFNGDVKLYAAPVSEAKAQGVVMPEGWIPLTIEHEPGYPEDVAFGPKRMMDRLKKWLDRYFEMRLNAAPAAPAADAGIVDMYRHLQKVTPYRFKKIQDASITDGGDVMYFHKDRFDAALLADMAAHCAKESK